MSANLKSYYWLLIFTFAWIPAGDLFSSGAPPGKWEMVGPGVGGSAFFVRFDPKNPDIIYAGMDCGGFYRTADGGKKWDNLTLGLFEHCMTDNPEHMAFDPKDSNRIYVLATGVQISGDGGKTWETGLDGSKESWPDVRNGRIEVNPYNPHEIYAGFMSGLLWKSGDYGKTWEKLYKFPSRVSSVSFLPESAGKRGTVFVSTRNSGVFKSDDGGVKWSEINKGLPNKEIRRISAAFDEKTGEEAVYACVQTKMETGKPETYEGGVFKSGDRGESWTDCGKSLPRIKIETDFDREHARYHGVFAVTPREIYAFGYGFKAVVCRSTDGGLTWESRHKHSRMSWIKADISCLNKDDVYDVCAANPGTLAIADTWQIWLSKDGGNTHTAVETEYLGGGRWKSAGTNHLCSSYEKSVRVDPLDSKRIYFGYHDVTFLSSDDGGKTYFRYFFEPDMIPFMRPTSIIPDPAVAGRVYMSFQNATTFQHPEPVTIKLAGAALAGGVAVSNDFGRSWAVSYDVTPGAGWKSLDGTKAEEWKSSPVKHVLPAGLPKAPFTCLEIDESSPAEARGLYASAAGHGVYKSSDSGKTWRLISPLPIRGMEEIIKTGQAGPQISHLKVAGHDKVYAVVMEKSKSWEDWYGTGFLKYPAIFSGDTGELRFEWDKSDPGYSRRDRYQANCKIYLTEDGGENWRLVNGSQFRAVPVMCLRVDPANNNRLLACGYGGVFESLDGGRSFHHLLKHYCINDVQFDKSNPRRIYAGAGFKKDRVSPSEAGVLFSGDNGKTWSQLRGIPGRVVGIEVDPNNPDIIYAGTFGHGAWRWTWSKSP
jgi:photosystem II stability/assembly factor-like uncharacterized protein